MDKLPEQTEDPCQSSSPATSHPLEIVVKCAAMPVFFWQSFAGLQHESETHSTGTATPAKALALEQLLQGEPTWLVLQTSPEDPMSTSQAGWRQLWAACCCGVSCATPR